MFKLLAFVFRLLAWKLDPPAVTIENSVHHVDPLANLAAAQRHIRDHYYGTMR